VSAVLECTDLYGGKYIIKNTCLLFECTNVYGGNYI